MKLPQRFFCFEIGVVHRESVNVTIKYFVQMHMAMIVIVAWGNLNGKIPTNHKIDNRGKQYNAWWTVRDMGPGL